MKFASQLTMRKIFALLLLLFSTAVFAQDAPVFTGHGDAVLLPSNAQLWLTIYYKGPEIGELFGRLEGRSARLHDVFKTIGILPKDIIDEGNKITVLNDNPKTTVWERYMLSRKLTVTIRDLNLLSKAMTKAKEEEVEQIDGPFFDYPDRDKSESTAFENAIADLKKKAEAGLGKKLGDPHILSKNVTTNPDPMATVPGQERLSVDITASF